MRLHHITGSEWRGCMHIRIHPHANIERERETCTYIQIITYPHVLTLPHIYTQTNAHTHINARYTHIPTVYTCV